MVVNTSFAQLSDGNGGLWLGIWGGGLAHRSAAGAVDGREHSGAFQCATRFMPAIKTKRSSCLTLEIHRLPQPVPGLVRRRHGITWPVFQPLPADTLGVAAVHRVRQQGFE